jgi:hypothetical protein
MKSSKTLSALLTITLLHGCGANFPRQSAEDKKDPSAHNKGSGQEESKTLPAATSQEVEADEELAAAEVTDNVDEALSSLADVNPSSATGLNLVAEGESKHKLTHKCSEVDSTAVVDVSIDFVREWGFANRLRHLTHAISDIGSIKRIWSNPDQSVKCDEGGQTVAISPEELEGSKLAIELSREKSKETSFKNLRSGAQFSRSMKLSVSGKRSAEWDAVEVSESAIVESKLLTSDVKRNLQVTNKSGEKRQIERQVRTVDDKPLAIVVTREPATLKASSRLIKTGSIEAIRSDKGRVVTHFDNVLLTKASGCVAESGRITGEIYALEAAEPVLSFVVEFDDGSAKVVFSNGKEAEYTPEGCDLENLDKMGSQD